MASHSTCKTRQILYKLVRPHEKKSHSLKHSTCKTSQIGLNTFSLNHSTCKTCQTGQSFWKKKKPATYGDFEQKLQFFQSKSDFFPIGKNDVTNLRNTNNFISPELHMSQFWARSENLFWPKKVKFFKVNRIFFQLDIRNPECSKFK